ncbi:X-ray radiation resistance-associated protein 1 isoform X2 [Anabas testudineus]|uniref:X-ray radiation resistance-associated protein 1 isoform X2 n=1 Tax=Anabas testudineus TaxID=64144 RepID=UPI000E45752B|nr:X-ray radiation resistance-associated protein 1 isoform X2 [Anabas testudineus]
MSAAPCKSNDGLMVTNCFPARTLLRRSREGAGHWLVAYTKAEEQNYKSLNRRIKDRYKGSSVTDSAGKTLDGPLLLQLHCVDKPSELCSVDISEQNLNSVKPEDLKMFDNVAYIDACINCLSLGSFSSFVSLRELNLSLNGICNMTFDAADFHHLEILNLSYNYLSADDIVSVGRLPRLKVLHLTGNQLHHLPPNLGSSSREIPQLLAKEEDAQFSALEVLMLDDNKLSSGVFSSVANLKRLKYLNLQGNRVSQVPYLQLMGGSEPAQTSVEEQTKEEGVAHTGPDPNTEENFKWIPEENWEGSRSSLPLPELQFLNLANNKIAEEEALMPVALFPVLREIDIHSNPLTTERSGDPPLLTYYLQERLGITIKRKKTQDIVKLPLKVESRVPHVLKKPLLMDTTRPAQTQVEKSEETLKGARESEGNISRDDTFQKHTEHFFVTQATDVPEYDLRTDEKQTAVNKESDVDDGIPEDFDCYKMLMDAKLNPDAVEPIGIQTAVRMLEHTLKNLNVYRDSKPKLDSIQTAYREREKRIQNLPPLKPIKQQSERVDEMIKEIKRSTTITEVDLSSVVRSTAGVNRQEHKEALSLLRDMKTKYKMVYKKTMEQAFDVESNRNADLNKAEPLRTSSN